MTFAGASVDGDVVVVTGGGTGIGAAIAERFAAEGAQVVVLGRRREPLDLAASARQRSSQMPGTGALSMRRSRRS